MEETRLGIGAELGWFLAAIGGARVDASASLVSGVVLGSDELLGC
jgi:hypothetical protein